MISDENMGRKNNNMVIDAFLELFVFSDHEGDLFHSGIDSSRRVIALRLADKILRGI